MICSSVSRVFFIVRPLNGPDSNRRWWKNPVAGQWGYYPTGIARGFRPIVDLLLTRGGERKKPPVGAALKLLF